MAAGTSACLVEIKDLLALLEDDTPWLREGLVEIVVSLRFKDVSSHGLNE
jgi:hypothetical protein